MTVHPRLFVALLVPWLYSAAAQAQVAAAMGAASTWLITVVIAAAVLVIIVAAIGIGTGRFSVGGALMLIGGLAAATHPEEIAAFITG